MSEENSKLPPQRESVVPYADAGIAGGGGRDASKRSTHALERRIFFLREKAASLILVS